MNFEFIFSEKSFIQLFDIIKTVFPATKREKRLYKNINLEFKTTKGLVASVINHNRTIRTSAFFPLSCFERFTLKSNLSIQFNGKELLNIFPREIGTNWKLKLANDNCKHLWISLYNYETLYDGKRIAKYNIYFEDNNDDNDDNDDNNEDNNGDNDEDNNDEYIAARKNNLQFKIAVPVQDLVTKINQCGPSLNLICTGYKFFINNEQIRISKAASSNGGKEQWQKKCRKTLLSPFITRISMLQRSNLVYLSFYKKKLLLLTILFKNNIKLNFFC